MNNRILPHIADLTLDERGVQVAGDFRVVGFDAVDVVRRFGQRQILDQSADGCAQLTGSRGRTAQCRSLRIAFGKEVLEDRMAAAVHGVRQVATQQVAVLFHEATHQIRHTTGVVFQYERIDGRMVCIVIVAARRRIATSFEMRPAAKYFAHLAQ